MMVVTVKGAEHSVNVSHSGHADGGQRISMHCCPVCMQRMDNRSVQSAYYYPVCMQRVDNRLVQSV